MLRVINFFCVALAGFACFAANHVSEQTRVAHLQLEAVKQNIVVDNQNMKVLQADWQRVADPARIQRLAQQRLGMSNDPMKEYASLQDVPRLGQALPGDQSGEVSNASAVVPSPNSDNIRLVAVQTGN
jgi:hypothetical protein